ncbi:MAG: menaquinone biosynthesis protein [Bryobacteraceae bacterium]|nr:menaquinone biosynthesis protein [Bryobacteraceae bacterium]
MCAVGYLNTVPLVWGMLHGQQRGLFQLSFCVPSECADRLEDGSADIGIVPAVELPRLGLDMIPGSGIASFGPVRSILLVSKRPLREVRTLAGDSSSRTSVVLARIILSEIHGSAPRVMVMRPDLPSMLEAADAALVIGDPALRVEPASLPHQCWDLGDEWTRMTGLPMVFAVWAGRNLRRLTELEAAFNGSRRFGLANLEQIIRAESESRRISQPLVRAYLTRHVRNGLGENEYKGLELYLKYAAKLNARPVPV